MSSHKDLGPAELHYTIMPCCAEKLLVNSASGPQAFFTCFQAGCLCFYSVGVNHRRYAFAGSHQTVKGL
jgi:hypothetical protein